MQNSEKTGLKKHPMEVPSPWSSAVQVVGQVCSQSIERLAQGRQPTLVEQPQAGHQLQRVQVECCRHGAVIRGRRTLMPDEHEGQALRRLSWTGTEASRAQGHPISTSQVENRPQICLLRV